MSGNTLLPESDFQLYAVNTRYPQQLTKQLGGQISATAQPGVYNLYWSSNPIRIIVTTEIAEQPHNAFWHLFSNRAERVRYGYRQCRLSDSKISTIVYQLLHYYIQENPSMSFTLEDFNREEIPKILASLSAEERLQGLAAEERIKGLSKEELQKLQQTLAVLLTSPDNHSGEH
ncbi:hypothetical protein D5085_07020 [Ectothiorhodospiraceae bacterium BW-2]|nr:hypothetical protein D5085_07020 [Ectothiorhodospiraceae bacterium BW-2]